MNNFIDIIALQFQHQHNTYSNADQICHCRLFVTAWDIYETQDLIFDSPRLRSIIMSRFIPVTCWKRTDDGS